MHVMMREVRLMQISLIIGVSMLVAGSEIIDFSESDANEENEFESEALTFAEADEAGQNEAGGHDNTGGGDGGRINSSLFAGGTAMLLSIFMGSVVLEVMKIALLGAIVTPLLSTMISVRDDLLTRGRILGYLEGNAGIHFSALRDALGLANGVTAYHLQILESKGEVLSWRNGKLRRYAVSGLSSEEIAKIRNPISGTRLAILQVLSESGLVGTTGKNIQIKLKISRQLLSHHMRELRINDLIEPAEDKKRPKWRISGKGIAALANSHEFIQSQ